jgi:fructose-1,6-bisphosphatase II / sedoheptulose-1,7-bisphosphatase
LCKFIQNTNKSRQQVVFNANLTSNADFLKSIYIMKNVTDKFDISNNNLPEYVLNYAAETTEAAAIACYNWIGKGNNKAADHAAVEAMRKSLNDLPISGKVVIGEGERDQAPMLFIGEKVGRGGIAIDIALDPLEGTTLCANDAPEAITTLAFAEAGSLLHAPDSYMEKIAVGANLPEGVVDLDNSVTENIIQLAAAKNKTLDEVWVSVLNRARHEELIQEIRKTGARIQLINDGDVMAAIAAADPNNKIDMYIGTGGAPEGVLAAAALKCLGGQMQGRLAYTDDTQRMRAYKMLGKAKARAKLNINDMAAGEVIFAATGVTTGNLLKGVEKRGNVFTTHTLILSKNNISKRKNTINL